VSSSRFLYNSIACQTICPSPSPKPFSQLREIVILWPGQIPGKGQVQLRQGYKKEPLSAILCLCVCLAGVSTCLHPLIKRNCLVKIFCLLCVFFGHWRVFNSNTFYSPFLTFLSSFIWASLWPFHTHIQCILIISFLTSLFLLPPSTAYLSPKQYSFLSTSFFPTYAEISHTRENVWHLSFWIWLFSLNFVLSSSIQFPANKNILHYGI
jgi:hypothetical protein